MTDLAALAELERVADALRDEPEVSCLSPESAFRGRAYRYITAADRLPPTRPADGTDNALLCRVRLFNPTGIGTWWLATYDPSNGVAFGVASLGPDREAGDIWLPELVAYRGRVRLAGDGASRPVGPGLPIERDLYYTPVTVAAVLAGGGN